MADFLLNYTGNQINNAISSVLTANNNGGIVNASTFNNFPSVLYPVGSVYIMSTNSNPSGFLGGTWELIDKEFKFKYINSYTPTLNTTNCTTAAVEGLLSGHSIWIKFQWTNKTVVNDNNDVQRFTINPNTFGVDAFYAENFPSYTDAGNAIIQYNLSTTGIISTYDTTTSVSAGTSISITTKTFTTAYTHMLDSFCDKFYFKRTA